MGKKRRPVACEAKILTAKQPIFGVRVWSHTYGVSILSTVRIES